MDELFTRCPTCKTVFRTREDQLSVQSGKVRCGHCRMVFDGRAQLVDLTPRHMSDAEEDALGPPAVTLRRSMDLSPVAAHEFPPPQQGTYEDPAATPDEQVLASAPTSGEHSFGPPQETEVHDTTPTSEAEEITPYRWQRGRRPGRAAQWTYGSLSALLLLALVAQAIYYFRHAVAADQPSLRPYLVSACATLGCTIEPLRNKEDIAIVSHDLQADPAHQGLLILQTTMRNGAPHPVAFPHMELELDDIAGRPVVRKVFAPTDYAGAAADFVNGIPAHGEWSIKLFLDASGVGAGGYNLYIFYP